MLLVLAIIATTCTGLLVGVELAVAVFLNPILRGLPVHRLPRRTAQGGRMLGRVMPFWYVGSTILLAALTALTLGKLLGRRRAPRRIAAPDQRRTVGRRARPAQQPGGHLDRRIPPENWQELQQRWDRLHIVRVALIVAAFALVVVATALL